MIRKIYHFICFTFVLLHLQAWQFNNPYRQPQVGEENQWFEQIVDHYDYTSAQTWPQKYFVFDQFFNPTTGAVILYIGGQGPLHALNPSSWTANIAKQTQSLVLSLQHRFYGESMPFGNQSMEINNLKFLSAEQALKDLAYFETEMIKGKYYDISARTPWITVGGSYPGALSAWFRSKYPHLTVGSIASSAVIKAIENFRQFDAQIYNSTQKSGSYCTQAIRMINQYVQNQVTNQHHIEFQAQFNAEQLNSRQFLFYWSDVIVFQIQYGKRSVFCNSLKNKTQQQIFQVIKALALKVSPVDYGSFYLANASYAWQNGGGGRAWYYQSCTQFSYFQTYSEHPMRSKLLTIDFYRAWCEDIFGKGTWPFVSRVNNEFAGLNIKATNLFMTNGVQDPWRWASLQQKKTGIISKVIQCENCAHCVDLKIPNKQDSRNLVKIRAKQLKNIKLWISDHYKKL